MGRAARGTSYHPGMDELTSAQEQAYGSVTHYLRQSFGELASPAQDAPWFSVDYARGGILVAVHAMGEEDASLQFYRWVGRGIEVTPAVAERLLEMSGRFRFGCLSIDDERDILFDYSVPAAGQTKATVAFLTRTMATTADAIDDELRMSFG